MKIKEVEIDNIKFKIKALGILDLIRIGEMAREVSVGILINFMINAGTVEPKIEDINSYPAATMFELARLIHEYTLETSLKTDPELAKLVEKYKEELEKNKPPSGMIV